ncbi:alpha/beta hydrolase [Sphingomonas sp. Y38-1Y]|uniref:alpha/beta hydrolase n=1 Tax=Sphingomonas sp. Y38-1Y TaxID=3078265 RepID=UPI0028F07C67|nr:alpha/beta fold hydrolase [Sphingomonas sp. Y38-1Y]
MKHVLKLALLLAAVPVAVSAQVATPAPPAVPGAKPVGVERIKVHSPSIAGNLEGDSADRDVLVILPPGYKADARRRYPVVYALHGYSIGAEQWAKEIHVPGSIEGAFGKGAREMIVVMPDSKTVHNGSMYSRSPTTGDFEMFIARDLVAAIDARYRTLPKRESRGLVGHSMGGYGASRIGMNHSDVFGALYMMSPCCMSARSAQGLDAKAEAAFAGIRTMEDAQKLGWLQRATLAAAAAWSPNPKKAPLYLDLPFGDEAQKADVLARWAANAPLAFVDQHVGDLKRYKAIALDVGDKDGLAADTAVLHAKLGAYGITHDYEVYDGDHTNRIGLRVQEKVLPFFSRHLAFR